MLGRGIWGIGFVLGERICVRVGNLREKRMCTGRGDFVWVREIFVGEIGGFELGGATEWQRFVLRGRNWTGRRGDYCSVQRKFGLTGGINA